MSEVAAAKPAKVTVRAEDLRALVAGIFAARGVADQRVMRAHGRRYTQRDWRSSAVRHILGPVKEERSGEKILVP